MSVQIQYRRGTAAEWAEVNPVLAAGEPGWEIDTGVHKTGNGTAAWADLPQNIPAGVSDVVQAVESGRLSQSALDEAYGGVPDITVDTSVGTRVFIGGVMVHGDTGWRDISDLLISGVQVSSNLGSCIIRRQGRAVTVALKVDITEGGITSFFESVPTGFRGGAEYVYDNSVFTADHTGAGASSLEPTHIGVIYPGGSIVLRTGSATPFPNPGTVAWTVTWTTSNSWPASLPGSPA